MVERCAPLPHVGGLLSGPTDCYSSDKTEFKEKKLGSARLLLIMANNYLKITTQELGTLFTEGNENSVCATSVFLTHLVLNLEHLERHTPSKNINMESPLTQTTLIKKSPITMFSHMLTRPLNPLTRNTKYHPAIGGRLGRREN